jgi:hypothetical protein
MSYHDFFKMYGVEVYTENEVILRSRVFFPFWAKIYSRQGQKFKAIAGFYNPAGRNTEA